MKLKNKITTTTRLGGYLTAAVTCSTVASTSQAAVVAMDITTIDGPNGGNGAGFNRSVNLATLSPGLRGYLSLFNSSSAVGITANGLFNTWVAGYGNFASPRKFDNDDAIDSSVVTGYLPARTLAFTYSRDGVTHISPDFGPGSFIGFKDQDGRYGYLEVTWTAATRTYEIHSGAYESVPGVAIRGVATIPEPSTAVLSLGALAAGAFIRRRKQAA